MLKTVNIVNIHDKHENKVDINREVESADDFVDEIDNLGLWRLSIIFSVGQFRLPNIKTAWKTRVTQPFNAENFFYPTHFSSVPTPL